LTELLVVIGIIAVLVALTFGATSAARRDSNAVRCQSNVRQLAMGVLSYVAISHGKFSPNVVFPSPGQYWFQNERVGQFLPFPTSLAAGTDTVYACPEDDDGLRSYAINVWASSKVEPAVLAPPAKGQLWSLTSAGAHRMLLLAEAWSYTGSSMLGWSAPPFVGASGTPSQRFGGGGGLTPFPTARWGTLNCELTYARHRRKSAAGTRTEPTGRIAIAFGDGHVELLHNDQLVHPVTGKLTGACYWSPLDPL
jgi:prepilin-type processing-associated H-X9-DG protein